ncbi:FAD binding domain-containing protein [Bradyrhizobium sp.]|uniref:FAD binding domain-containing protein n=1 Tax=Bradyrhizobium sp. TaxID=376 RepID=UPI0025C72211|nr:xanthine dehydrogenase family protein subunit M [Bradyrhizobium sp.]MBV8918052.1 xanthine dehydrogenase family protein subunit M [Bradyrhizobium sp.]
MTPFDYVRAGSMREAVELRSRSPNAAFLAGGTTLTDLMKGGVEKPSLLVDIRRVPDLDYINVSSGKASLGALTKNSDLATDPALMKAAPMLTQAIAAGASPQIRNMATLGGNLLQRTRCPYFRNQAFACNKRSPGSGCAALTGYDRGHAVLEGSSQCVATHPSDLAVALVALGGEIQAEHISGQRNIPLSEFFRPPGETPWIETSLQRGALIVFVETDLPPEARRSVYLKVRDRASYEFALASAAVGLHQDGSRIIGARIALGGIATRPLRFATAEASLIGRTADEAAFRDAAAIALGEARPGRENGFKVELAKRTLVKALKLASELQQ